MTAVCLQKSIYWSMQNNRLYFYYFFMHFELLFQLVGIIKIGELTHRSKITK